MKSLPLMTGLLAMGVSTLNIMRDKDEPVTVPLARSPHTTAKPPVDNTIPGSVNLLRIVSNSAQACVDDLEADISGLEAKLADKRVELEHIKRLQVVAAEYFNLP
jgi:hypothetical protein